MISDQAATGEPQNHTENQLYLLAFTHQNPKQEKPRHDFLRTGNKLWLPTLTAWKQRLYFTEGSLFFLTNPSITTHISVREKKNAEWQEGREEGEEEKVTKEQSFVLSESTSTAHP